MASYPINKGVGKAVEVKGLVAPYLLWLVIGIVLSLLVLFLLSIISVVWGIVVGTTLLIGVVRYCFYANKKYGPYGWMQRRAVQKIPPRIAFSFPIYQLVRIDEKNIRNLH
ncbi:MAG: DUF4133 domain-containing protein [Paludibacteraceae bacterium]|nr:DUF4133 domain-containing protein [Paludibacteraceae bacterium]